jgi:hypothetical protein
VVVVVVVGGSSVQSSTAQMTQPLSWIDMSGDQSKLAPAMRCVLLGALLPL